MKTKAEIVQRLLEEEKIDAEEAVVLLMADHDNRTIFINPVPYVPPIPAYPVYPIYPLPTITSIGQATC